MILHKLDEIDTIPDDIIQLVKESVINTFTSICGNTPQFVHSDEETGPLNGIIGNIAVFNPSHTLSLMLVIPKDTALSLSEAFIGMEIPFESDDMGDLVGEISNILAGDVAASIENIGFRGQSSLPTATRGSDLTLFMPNKPPSKKMKFSGDNGEFWLNMALSKSN